MRSRRSNSYLDKGWRIVPTIHAQRRAIERFDLPSDEAADFLVVALCGDQGNESAAFVPRHRWEFYKWGYHPTATDELHAAMYVNRFSWRGQTHQIVLLVERTPDSLRTRQARLITAWAVDGPLPDLYKGGHHE